MLPQTLKTKGDVASSDVAASLKSTLETVVQPEQVAVQEFTNSTVTSLEKEFYITQDHLVRDGVQHVMAQANTTTSNFISDYNSRVDEHVSVETKQFAALRERVGEMAITVDDYVKSQKVRIHFFVLFRFVFSRCMAFVAL